MISTYALSLLLLKNDQNRVYETNLRLIQELMRSDEPSVAKFKLVYADLPNLALLTKSATPGEVQVTYAHESIGNKSLGKNVTSFALVELLEALNVVQLKLSAHLQAPGTRSVFPPPNSFSTPPTTTYPSLRRSDYGRR